MIQQVDLIHMKPLPLPPPPEPNVFMYGETITEVEEYWKYEKWIEKPTAKEIITRIFYCEYASFHGDGVCHGGCDSEHDIAICMKLSKALSSEYATDDNMIRNYALNNGGRYIDC